MKDATILKITAILAITAIEVANILTSKIDGAILGVIIGAIAGLAGYTVGKKVS